MDPQEENDHHHQKPPPPYEEVPGNMDGRNHNHHLSIENPMAEVFANAQFDHVEMKIQSPINPGETSGGAAGGRQRIRSAANLASKKARQAFVQWRDWHHPEVNLLRLASLALLLLVAVQLVRMVLPVMSDRANGDSPVPPPPVASAAHPLKVHSARTGKALSSLLEPDLDRQNQFEPAPDAATVTKTIRNRLEEPDQDIIMGPDAPVTATVDNQLPAMEKEPLIPEQELLESNHHQHQEEISTLPTADQSRVSSMTTQPSTVAEKRTTGSSSSSSSTSRWSQVPISSTVAPKISGSMTTTTTTTTIRPTPASPTYNISIIIHSANVPDMDSGYLMGRASDTYCNVFIDDVLVGKTPIIDNSNNPSWHYLLPRQFPVRKDTWIRIELMDSDHVRNDHIGGILLNFGDLLKNGSINKPINMFHGRGYIWVTISSQNL